MELLLHIIYASTPIAITVWFFVTFWFFVSYIVKRNDVADVAWGLGISLVAVTAFAYTSHSNHFPTLLVLVGMSIIWGGRLAWRIARRHARTTEDRRYALWRNTWGTWFYVRSYLQVFLLQGALMLVVGYPFIHVALLGDVAFTLSSEIYGGAFLLGLLMWGVGFFFEVAGDRELDVFLKNPLNKGKILTTGLWRYTRHPNYFGEALMWWGIFIIVLPLPFGGIAIISPLVITFLLVKVSGIPMAEKHMEGVPAFEEYKKRTSAFFPLPPRT